MESRRRDSAGSQSSAPSVNTAAGAIVTAAAQTRDASTFVTPRQRVSNWWAGVGGSAGGSVPRQPGTPTAAGADRHRGNSDTEGPAGAGRRQHQTSAGHAECKAGNGKGVAEASSETPRFWRASDYNAEEFAAARRASERVILNLSGTTFMTTRDTLARDPHTYFAAMLRMQQPSTPTGGCAGNKKSNSHHGSANGTTDNGNCSSNGGMSGGAGEAGQDEEHSSSSCPRYAGHASGETEFFIDRDPTHFRFILNYLRDSYIGLDSFGEEDMHFLEELSHEAQFFNIAGLCADIARRVSEIARMHRDSPSGDKDFRLVQCSTGQIQDVFHEWVIDKNYEFECMQVVQDTAYIVLGRRVSRGELALVERLMKT